MAYVIEDDGIDWAQYEAETEEQTHVRSAGVYRDEVIESFFREDGVHGDRLPWAKTHDIIRLRPGETTVWAGSNGHGKSLLTGQVVLGLMAQGRKACVASFEMKPTMTLRRMTRQASQGSAPSRQFGHQFFDWSDPLLSLYDRQGNVHPSRVLAVARFAAKELGTEHFVIDSLMKCVRGEDDMNGQKAFVGDLCTIAADTGMHIHLVHHIRKGDEFLQPTKYDLKGSGSISDQVDNVMLVWRNKRKERDVRESGENQPDTPDAFLLCEKQRNGEGDVNEGKFGLWLDLRSQQFVGAAGGRTLDFVGGLG